MGVRDLEICACWKMGRGRIFLRERERESRGWASWTYFFANKVGGRIVEEGFEDGH